MFAHSFFVLLFWSHDIVSWQVHEISRARAMHCLPCRGACRVVVLSTGDVIVVCRNDEGTAWQLRRFTVTGRFMRTCDLTSPATRVTTVSSGDHTSPLLLVADEAGFVRFYDVDSYVCASLPVTRACAWCCCVIADCLHRYVATLPAGSLDFGGFWLLPQVGVPPRVQLCGTGLVCGREPATWFPCGRPVFWPCHHTPAAQHCCRNQGAARHAVLSRVLHRFCSENPSRACLHGCAGGSRWRA